MSQSAAEVPDTHQQGVSQRVLSAHPTLQIEQHKLKPTSISIISIDATFQGKQTSKSPLPRTRHNMKFLYRQIDPTLRDRANLTLPYPTLSDLFLP